MSTNIVRNPYHINGTIATAPCSHKTAILQYLRSIHPVAVAAGYVFDYVVDDEITGMENYYYESGNYSWDTEDIYHFDKYDIELDQEFVDYVITHGA